MMKIIFLNESYAFKGKLGDSPAKHASVILGTFVGFLGNSLCSGVVVEMLPL